MWQLHGDVIFETKQKNIKNQLHPVSINSLQQKRQKMILLENGGDKQELQQAMAIYGHHMDHTYSRIEKLNNLNTSEHLWKTFC